MKDVKIVHRARRENTNADALSRSHQAQAPAEGIAEGEIQVAAVSAQESHSVADDLASLLRCDPAPENTSAPAEQKKDLQLAELIDYLEHGSLPDNPQKARKVAAQGPLFCIALIPSMGIAGERLCPNT